ncbi:TcpQ domain-containing protein [Caballeronia sp. LP003]|uniref:toxin co-regulated pilus biosynthesis Q family protein n=1 Tax=Caballeronia sp. LP003 TaxID=3038551 RepID=UPI0028598560|nr:TcpQ domain-containing protein [Caballeronia sp. LP003]MDR5791729.1 TcpQ domain-containing protein [Caballeronia sp. LP003]
MRKLVLALALAPAVSHATLVVDGGAQSEAAPLPPTIQKAAVIVPTSTRPSIVAAPPIIAPTPAVTKLAPAIVPQPPMQVAQSSPASLAPATQMAVSTEPLSQFDLRAGQSIQAQLQQWAKRAGWTLTWNSPDDWIVPGDMAFGADFQKAAESALEQLGKNGADIRADIWVGNRSIVVDQAGAIE